MKISVSPAAFILSALLLLILPLQWVVAAIMAILVHEGFHTAAVYLLGGRILRVYIGANGAVLETSPLPAGREFLAALAGPVGSGLLLLLASRFPRLAICGAFHCAYNLVPLFPLDGGRMLKNLLFWLLPTFRAEQVYRISQQAVAMLLIIGCVLFSLKIGFLPLIALGFLLRKARSENPLANRSGFRYNRSNTNKGVRL